MSAKLIKTEITAEAATQTYINSSATDASAPFINSNDEANVIELDWIKFDHQTMVFK